MKGERNGAPNEFSACIYAPGAGQYLRDCISIFEEYGWDWSYHAFREALRDGTLKGILWHQGCTDANNITNAETYAARLVPMVAQLRKDLGAEDVPFVAEAVSRIESRGRGKKRRRHFGGRLW